MGEGDVTHKANRLTHVPRRSEGAEDSISRQGYAEVHQHRQDGILSATIHRPVCRDCIILQDATMQPNDCAG